MEAAVKERQLLVVGRSSLANSADKRVALPIYSREKLSQGTLVQRTGTPGLR
jgi:hypothetical protein